MTPRSSPQIPSQAQTLWLAAMPGLFVVLWSTGFIGSKLGLPYAEPMTFLLIRFVIVAVLLGVVSLVLGAAWPTSWRQVMHLGVAGLLLHGLYLGGVFAAIFHGVAAGVSSLIVGIQPLLVAAVAGRFLGETVSRLQWVGLVLGVAGVLLVVDDKLAVGEGSALGYGLCVLALFGITIGTVYQKKYCGAVDMRTGNTIQFAISALGILPFALVFETMQVDWHPRFVFALAWLCLVLSVGAITLLYLLIRRGAAAKVASLFYMVPPCTALIAWPLFGETLGPVALAGMAATVLGVALVNVKR